MNTSGSIKLYSEEDLAKIRLPCRLARSVLDYASSVICPGLSTETLNDLCHEYIISCGALSATLGYRGFPKSICTSVNHVVCHGIPDGYRLKPGDIINVDVTVLKDGWFGDTSRMFLVGKCSRLAETLIQAAEAALWIGIEQAIPGNTFGDIGFAISNFVSSQGFSVVRDYGGHGIGTSFHEDPLVLHFGNKGEGPELKPGMFFTIEPMVNAGRAKTKILRDGWTVVTADKSLSAQFEHTVAITASGCEVLTL
jgi:methionyl aminopeptidase